MESNFEQFDDLLRRLTENRDSVEAMILATLLDESDILTSIAYSCAVPRTFSSGIIVALSESKISEPEASDLLNRMKDWEFVQEFGREEFSYRQEVREYLLSKLQKDEPEKFILLNKHAYDFYFSKLPEGWDVNERVWLNLSNGQVDALREVVYHLLHYDPENGFDLFRKMFERAVRLHLVEETFALTKFLTQADGGHFTPAQNCMQRF
jgi:hypothetical protein